MGTGAILWRRLDVPGHDACRLVQQDGGWRLKGTAVFQHERAPACLAYEVVCDTLWQTREGFVNGWVGKNQVEFHVAFTPGGKWTLNGQVLNLEGCIDLDLGFTPATNLFHLQRAALKIGQAIDMPVAWLDSDAGTLGILHQRYERRTSQDYWYEAPRFDYFALLHVNSAGFIEKYPKLWKMEA
jgi:hypothetical protein